MSTATAEVFRRDATLMGVVGFAHFFSHFYQLVLPPLFPLLREGLEVSYAELGLLMTVFFVTSGLCQPPAGFLVDRIGPLKVLLIGLVALVVSVTAMGFVPAFWMLLPLAALAGFGNSVFHPADYSLLTSGVSAERLGRAYGVHTIGGTLGWAAAPMFMVAVASLASWRWALIAAGLAGLVIVVPLIVLRDPISRAEPERRPAPSASRSERARANMRLLFQPEILLCFLFFVFLAAAFVGAQAFMPATLTQLYATPLAIANAALTTFMLGSALGTLAGGVLVDRQTPLESVITWGLLACAALFVLIGQVDLGSPLMLAAVLAAGACSGAVTPARDMMVRRVTPPGSAGKVFGFVYSGLDIGAAAAPFMLGLLLDAGYLRAVFTFIAFFFVLTMAAGRLVGAEAAGRR